jgi:hypothetical protein
MMRDLTELQHEAFARGYAHHLGCDYPDLTTSDLRLIDSTNKEDE